MSSSSRTHLPGLSDDPSKASEAALKALLLSCIFLCRKWIRISNRYVALGKQQMKNPSSIDRQAKKKRITASRDG